jgi:hypothetical protein
MKLLPQCNRVGGQDSEELEALCVQCPPDALHQDLHVYASKTVAADGSLISVQCEPVKVVSTNDNPSTTGTTPQPYWSQIMWHYQMQGVEFHFR